MPSRKMNIRRYLASLGAGAKGAAGEGAASNGAAPPEAAAPPDNAEEATPPEPPPQFSSTALWGLLGFLLAPGSCLLGDSFCCFGWPIGAIWVTIMGVIAVMQIRYSAGRLTGLWLAILEAVLFPVIAFVLAAYSCIMESLCQ